MSVPTQANDPAAERWNPPVGRLILWTLAHGEHTEAQLGVATEPAGDHGTTVYRAIAETLGDGWAPKFARYTNGAPTHESRTGAGGRIVQRLATDEDIVSVVRAWQSRYPLDGWLRDIERAVGHVILPDELARLRRIVAEVTAAGEGR